MEREVFVKFQNPIKNLNELKVSVDYQKGGMNYFNGNMEQSGIYVYLTPTERTKYGFRTIISGNKKEMGFKIFIRPLSRKSQKAITEVFNKINQKELIENVTKYFEQERYADIVRLIKGSVS